MLNRQQVRTGNKSSMWLAFAVALGLHLLILLAPISRHGPPADNKPALLELQLTTLTPATPAPETPAPPAIEIPQEMTLPDIIPEPIEAVAKSIPEPPRTQEQLPVQPDAPNIEPMPILEQKKRRLSRTILSARLLPEESEADKIFGVQIAPPEQPNYAAFNRPIGQNMISMLDQPMQELPFAYTPGLVHFAYDPGVKGDLQRFWDVITPEFGWRTDNGTEFKCVLVLVIIGCGWK